MFINERQRLKNRLRMFRHFTAVVHDSFPITHPSVHDHFFGVSQHRLPAILNALRQPSLNEGRSEGESQCDNDEGLKDSAMRFRSLRVKLHFERGGIVRRHCHLPFLDTQNRMPGLHAVGAGRKITRPSLLRHSGGCRSHTPNSACTDAAALHGEDSPPFDQMHDIGGPGRLERRAMQHDIYPGMVVGVALNIVRHRIAIGYGELSLIAHDGGREETGTRWLRPGHS